MSRLDVSKLDLNAIPRPTFFPEDAESILADTKQCLQHAKQVQDDIVATVDTSSASFANTLLPFVQEENHRLHLRQLIEFQSKVSTDESVRDAGKKASELFADFDSEISVRDDLYALVAAVRDKHEQLDVEDQHLLDKLLLDFENNGLALPSDDRVQLRQLKKELAQTEQDYMKNVSTAKWQLWLTREDLAGVPNDVLEMLPLGDDQTKGKLCLDSDLVQYRDVMNNAHSQRTRRLVYLEDATSCGPNTELLEKAVRLRMRIARLLGYSNHAEHRMSTRMQKSPKVVQTFLKDLLIQLGPARDAAIREWRQAKVEDLQARQELDDGQFYPWDRTYYNKAVLLKKDPKLVGEGPLSDFFSLGETTNRMLVIFETVFGLSIKDVTEAESAALWHEDVRLFAVSNKEAPGKEAGFLGHLYMDMYPRPGKYQGYSDQPVHPAFTNVDGSRTYTATGMVCNFQKPTADKPCLLDHGQVTLLFHELGHAIHDLVAKTKYARFHGASCAGDFNESPSQMLEQWCYHAPSLRSLASHYTELSPEYLQAWKDKMESEGKGDANPPKTLSDAQIRSRVDSKYTDLLGQNTAILMMSLFDLALASVETEEEVDALNSTRLYHETIKRVFRTDIPNEDAPYHATEGHHFRVSGMDIYLQAQVYAMDMFHTAFQVNPVDPETGRRYREVVIGRGSSRDEMANLAEFLGRPPSSAAFFKEMTAPAETLAQEV